MSLPRSDFAAVDLPSAKVLLVGGRTSATADTATVDLYDPGANTTKAAASMHIARQGESATLLHSGKVLVAGGSATPGGMALASAELYDPVADSWTAAASMAQQRRDHVAVLMNNGKVYVTGGDGGTESNGQPGPSPTAPEVYDAATNTWTSAPTFYGARPYGPTATVLSDGRVMVIGGVAIIGPQTAELYDPATAQMVVGRREPVENDTRNFATAARLPDGRVIVVGGQDSANPTGALNSTDLFDAAMEVPNCGDPTSCMPWAAGPAMNVGHCRNTLTELQAGRLFVAGGKCGSQEPIAATELFDPASMRWWSVAPMTEPRGFHVAVLLSDGRLMVAGGILRDGSITATTEIYMPA